MVVSQTLGVSAVAGGVAELHLGMRLGGVDHVRLMTEAVGEDDVAAVVDQLLDGIGAGVVFRHVELVDDLVVTQAEGFLHVLGAQVMVVGVAHVAGVGHVHETELDGIQRNRALGGRGEDDQASEKHHGK